ncbi:hypothetical protein, partial [Bifidobacterium psychraerophilum]|uniref:hypothetical protein n=1 Tax=Bifidobacterium psychraerophilum TaxID=218140 RepID=UPI003340A263
MSGGAEVGSAHVSVFPVMTGFRQRVNQEMQASGKAGSTRFSKAFDGTGEKAGGKVGKAFKSSMQQSSANPMDDVLKKLQRDVASTSRANASAMLKQRDAAVNVRTAEEKLATATAKYGEGSTQAEKASIRLESARLREAEAASKAVEAAERMKSAQTALKVAQDSMAASQLGSINGFKAMASQMGQLARAASGVDTIFKPLTSRVQQLGLSIGSGFGVAFNKARATASAGANAVGAAFNVVGAKVSSVFSKVTSVAVSAASRLPTPFRAVGSTIGAYFTGIGAAAGGALSKIPAVAQTVAGGIGNAFKTAASAAKEHLASLGNGIRELASISMTGLLAGVTALGAAFVAVGKSALSAYSTYEQAVGGIDTLFKGASKQVQQSAAQAYKTAGVSANEYMTQITSFSASLISSLGGDTKKAATIGDQAMKDMSDNANKMGTDISSIQQTYQSIARGNYAMLDNLKLGYGGTKTEMERLLADAKKLTGQKYDISSFSDVIQAIHAVQTELGITGTTAKEAATTIEGSTASMKAAWSNWLTGLGTDNADMGALTDQLVSSISAVMTNVLPRIGQIAATFLKSIPGMLSGLTTLLPEPFQKALASIGSVINRFKPLVASLGAAFGALGFTSILGKLPFIGKAFTAAAGGTGHFAKAIGVLTGPIGIVIAAIGALIATSPELSAAFGGQMSAIFEQLGQIFSSMQPVFQQFAETIGATVQQIMPVITQVVAALIPVVGQIVQALLPLIPTILTPLMSILTQLAPLFAQLVTAILPPIAALIQALLPPLMQLISAVLPVVQALIAALMPVIQSVIASLTPIITLIGEVVSSLASALVPVIQALMPLVTTVLSAIAGAIQALMPVIQTIVNQVAQFINGIIIPVVRSMIPVVSSVISTIAAVIRGITKIVKGVVDVIAGIFSGDWQRVWNGMKGIVSGAIDAIGGFLGGMADIGRNLVEGL